MLEPLDTDKPRRILVTGGTGLIGHYLLRELVAAGHRCVLLLRPPVAESLERLCALLEEIGVDARRLVQAEQLMAVAGDLQDAWPRPQEVELDAVVHSAASTRFSESPDGEPVRTNVEGTRRLLEWIAGAGIRELHLVSSAYVCGRSASPVAERFDPRPASFHNPYERSKWDAERLCRDWAAGTGACLTVHRPSVVVGEFYSGRSSKFSGFYLMARATEFLDRAFASAPAAERQAIPLRIEGRPFDCQNIVPVDYVARSIAAIMSDPQWQGRTYHITHPNPPSNQLIKSAMESYFKVAGGRFVEPGTLARAELNEHERSFHDLSRSIGHYFVDTPVFDRAKMSQVEAGTNLACPAYDESALHRLLAFAQAAGWGRNRVSRPGTFSPCAAYFEHFLPRFVAESRVARMTGLSTTMRFVIEDEPDGQWVCRFEEGRLRTVHRGQNGIREEFGYRSTREVFWEAIAGHTHPQELFLAGRAELFGDMERAMKMAMILHEFTREHPCSPHLLVQLENGR